MRYVLAVVIGFAAGFAAFYLFWAVGTGYAGAIPADLVASFLCTTLVLRLVDAP